MKVKLEITGVADHDECVLACKIHDYIDNVLKHPEWFLKHEVPNFDYEREWLLNCNVNCDGDHV